MTDLAFDRSRRRHLRALLCTSLVMTSPALWAQAAGASVGGVSFGGRADVGGHGLRLNGVGLRASSTIKGFAAGAVPRAAGNSTEQVLGTPGPKRLRMRMLLDVPIEVFTHALRKGIRRNMPEPQQAALSERMGRFDGVLQAIGKVFDGDVIDLDYLPESGLRDPDQRQAARGADSRRGPVCRVDAGVHRRATGRCQDEGRTARPAQCLKQQ